MDVGPMGVTSSSISESCPYPLHSRYSTARQRSSESPRTRTEQSPSRQCARQRSRKRRRGQSHLPSIKRPRSAHLALTSTHLAISLLELDNQVKRLGVAARKVRKMQHERVVSAQRAVHAQSLRCRYVEGEEEEEGSMDELLRRDGLFQRQNWKGEETCTRKMKGVVKGRMSSQLDGKLRNVKWTAFGADLCVNCDKRKDCQC